LPIIATLIQQELRNPPVNVSQREALDQRSAFPHTAGEQPQRGQTDFRPFETEPYNLLARQEQYERILFRRGGGRIGSTVKNGDFRERRAGPLDMYDLLPSVRADAICPYGSLHYDVESGRGFAGEEQRLAAAEPPLGCATGQGPVVLLREFTKKRRTLQRLDNFLAGQHALRKVSDEA